MGFTKKNFEKVKKAYRRTWDISPETRVTPTKVMKEKRRTKKVDWQKELDDYENEIANDEVEIDTEK